MRASENGNDMIDVNDAAQKETSLESKSFEWWTTSDLSALLLYEHDERNDVCVCDGRGTKKH